jgi:transposase-like protein
MQNQNLTRRQPTANRIRQVDEKVKSVKVALEQINVKAAARKAGVASSTLRYDLGKLEMALPQILTNQAPGFKPVEPPTVAPTPAKENRECSECGGKVRKNGVYWILNWHLMGKSNKHRINGGALLVTLRFHSLQVCQTVIATLHTVYFHMIWVRNCLERFTRMSRLTTAILVTFLPQALGRLFQPIARWRFTAITAVLGYLIFQPLNTLGQLPKHLVEKLDDGFFANIVRSANFFIAW